MYDSHQINELANSVSLFDYIQETNNYAKRSGRNYYYHCPKHSDSDPSLCVNTDGNYYKCFSCGRSGNVLSYMMDYEDLSFKEAADKLVLITGSNLKDIKKSDSAQFFTMMRAERTKQKRAVQDREYQDYSQYNKYSKELPELWKSEGITDEAMREYDIRTDKYRNQIIYPIYDADGKYICPKARTTLDDFKILGLPKYRYLGKIGKNDFFVGWQQALPEIKRKKQVIVFEGIKSVMKAWSWGYKNCVAAETSCINDDQTRLLIASDADEVVVAFDKDKKIVDSVSKLSQLRKFCNVSVINDTMDYLGEKDSPVDKGREVFDYLINNRKRI